MLVFQIVILFGTWDILNTLGAMILVRFWMEEKKYLFILYNGRGVITYGQMGKESLRAH